jgi:hypothetical protein
VVVGNEQLTGALFDSTNASGTLGMLLQSTGTSTIWVATSTLGISGGSGVTGGTNGKVAVFTSATTLSAGDLFDNLTVSGVNATSSTVNFNVQGTGTLNPFNVASSTGISLLVVGANGTVGIGTATPIAMLAIEGTSTNPTVPLFVVSSSTGAQLMSIGANGRVGINSSSPVSQLTVVGTSTFNSLTIASATGATQLIVTSAGNVGIGTSGPISMFTINSAAALTNDLETITNVGNPVTVAGVNDLQMTYAGGAGAIESAAQRIDLTPGTTSGSTWSDLRLTGAATGPLAGVQENAIKIQGPSAWGAGGQFNGINITGLAGVGTATGTIVGLNIGSITGGSATETAISIGTGWDSALNIGTTSTSSLVGIYGNSANPIQNIFRVASSSGATFLNVSANGNVGIGTSNPVDLLQIANNGALTEDLNDTAGGAELQFNITSSALIDTANSTALGLGTHGSTNILIDTNGNVGIGNTAPSTELAVQGVAGSTDILNVASSSGISVLRVTATQRVGIGSTTPTATLTVQGTSTYPTIPVFTVASSTSAQLFTVSANGNVGVDTTTGTSLFAVQGAGTSDILDISSSSGSSILHVSSAGNVGIGTTTPGTALSVVGSITSSALSGSVDGVVYTDATGKLQVSATGGGGTLCLVSASGGAPAWSSCGGSASTAWSSLSNPSGNLTLGMAANTTAFTYGATTGANTNLFSLSDGSGNSGTGALFFLSSNSGSALNPFQVNVSSTTPALVVTAGSGFVGFGTATPTSALYVLNSTTSEFSIASTVGSSIFDVRNIGTNFGGAAYTGAFVSKDSYFGEEFTQFHSAVLSVVAAGKGGTSQVRGEGSTLTANTAGNNTLTFNTNISTATNSGCTASSTNALNGIETITASSTLNTNVSCMETMTTNASATLMSLFNGNNLPVVEIKASTTVVTAAGAAQANFASTTVWLGIGDTVVASATPPTNGIGFTNCMDLKCVATSTNWIGMVVSGGVAATTSCPSITLAKFALLRFEVAASGASGKVNFYAQNNLSNGPYETACGTVSASVPSVNMTVMMENAANGANEKSVMDVDYYRAWQDDAPILASNNPPAAQQGAQVASGPDLTTYAALSQHYPTIEPIPYGSIVSWDTTTSTPSVRLSNSAYDENMLGITVPDGSVSLNDMSGGSANVAISGRASVEASSENGAIEPGDYLTSSANIPGAVMKATKAGVVIGKALSGFSASGTGSVVVYINRSYFFGDIGSLASLNQGSGDTVSQNILSDLQSQNLAASTTASSTLSQIYTDRLAAALEVVSPQVTVNRLLVNSIQPVMDSNLNITMSSGKELVINNSSSSSTAITLDTFGNGNFTGLLTSQALNSQSLLIGATSTPTLYAQSGFVGINTSTPATSLYIIDNATTTAGGITIANSVVSSSSPVDLFRILSGTNNTVQLSVTSGGNTYIAGSLNVASAQGLSVMYPTSDSGLEVGDVVALATGTATSTYEVERASTSTPAVLGIAVQNQGLVLGQEASSTAAVTISGHAQVLVSMENGVIEPGDYLTLSTTTPGYAAKALYSGQVIGRALTGYDGTVPNQTMVLAEVNVGWANVNNAFVLQDSQTTGGVGSLPTTSPSSFLIDQKGSGNILQLQANEQDRFLVASSGAVSILANVSTSTASSTILTVVNASSTLFTINSVGDVVTTGHIIVGNDTAGTAVINTGDNQTTVTFARPYDSVPKVIVTADGVPNFNYGVINKTVNGFTIAANQPMASSTGFDWFVVEQPGDTASQSSVNITVLSSPSSTSSSGGSSGASAPPAPQDTGSGGNSSTTPDSGSTGSVAGDSTTTPSLDDGSSSAAATVTPTPAPSPTPTAAPTPVPTTAPAPTGP